MPDTTVCKISRSNRYGTLLGDVHATIDTMKSLCKANCSEDFWILLPPSTIKEVTCKTCLEKLAKL